MTALIESDPAGAVELIVSLLARVEELERRIGGSSLNSSLPPTRDSREQRKQRPRKKRSGRKQGGQPRHPDDMDAFRAELAAATERVLDEFARRIPRIIRREDPPNEAYALAITYDWGRPDSSRWIPLPIAAETAKLDHARKVGADLRRAYWDPWDPPSMDWANMNLFKWPSGAAGEFTFVAADLFDSDIVGDLIGVMHELLLDPPLEWEDGALTGSRSFEDQFVLDLCARLNDVDWSTCMSIREPFLVYPWLHDGDNDSLLPAAIPAAILPQLQRLGAL